MGEPAAALQECGGTGGGCDRCAGTGCSGAHVLLWLLLLFLLLLLLLMLFLLLLLFFLLLLLLLLLFWSLLQVHTKVAHQVHQGVSASRPGLAIHCLSQRPSLACRVPNSTSARKALLLLPHIAPRALRCRPGPPGVQL